jgi:hypothetical protein
MRKDTPYLTSPLLFLRKERISKKLKDPKTNAIKNPALWQGFYSYKLII